MDSCIQILCRFQKSKRKGWFFITNLLFLESKGWCIKFATGLNIIDRHSSKSISVQTVFLPKWSPHGRIILAKEHLNHLFTFWIMSILVFSPVANLMHHFLHKIWIWSTLHHRLSDLWVFRIFVHFFFVKSQHSLLDFCHLTNFFPTWSSLLIILWL